jgi:hypothetical protein
MKNGGADVRVFNREPINPEGENWRGKLVEHARGIAEAATEDDPLVGFFIIGMFGKGTTATGFRYDPQLSPIPRAMMPAYIAEIVRRDVLMAGEARDVFNEMFEWREG